MVALRLGPELRQVAVAAPSYLADRGAPASASGCRRARARLHPLALAGA